MAIGNNKPPLTLPRIMNWGDRHDRCAFCPQTIVDSCRVAVNEGNLVRCEWPLERRLKRGAVDANAHRVG